MLVLGIETSCDETAAAVVDDDGTIRSDIVLSQLEDHAPYGGVVPEIAARAHVDHLDSIIARAMTEAGVGYRDLDAVAATAGPGLIGGVMVGLMTGKAIAAASDRPFIAVNHLEGHALTVRLTHQAAFPYLLLLISGGHCQLLEVTGVGAYHRFGTTIDDAIGEAFDKTAKLLGLGFPGGPALEAAAKAGNPKAFALPRPLAGTETCDFSFSGLKTAVLHAVRGAGPLTDTVRADVAASFQAAVADVLADRVGRAMQRYAARHGDGRTLVVAGGVAANRTLGDRLATVAAAHDFALMVPPPRLCTDNAVMIAWAGLERLQLGLTDNLAAPPRARWPLDMEAAAAGAKA
ncbi:MAG: tRNA (adenosine(37)-N6)-threonylcarbamoyltransferase complex transferase subunit TsaD [Proteobacteria bacterium]|nr:tRNA (adenosine(37)-N6)-threonylcarbamoyltransferase complex transferase subunit TsaD [Pseudomonadota bacterium]MDA1059079.1 tRNA (adenosine(37)-N6)-threonylcarbamoyltransferase complex transferase subunit TsaD [Pseudomonadota bacterium]